MKGNIIWVLIISIILIGCSDVKSDQIKSKDTGPNEEEKTLAQEPYFPTNGWRSSTPEAQGMSSSKLIDVINKLDDWYKETNSVIVTRNGYIVAEKYYGDYTPEIKQWIYSATKSITTALVGIAVEQGYINLDDRVVDIFSNREIQNLDENKEKMTVEHLLTMRSGLENNIRTTYGQVLAAEDPVQFVLDLPMKVAPGSSYDYNSGNTHLLSAILQKQTGMNTVEFANTYLFQPLNIHNTLFSELNGVALGANGLAMTPRDMAKIGLLYLNEGKWDGEQVIPRDWIVASTTTSIEELFRGGTHYGYHWYIDEIANHTAYYAQGAYGQYIIVIPELKIVTVFTSNKKATLISTLISLVEPIINSVVSESPLDENEEYFQALQKLLVDQSNGDVKTVQQLPTSINIIDGENYSFDPNPFGWKEMSISFNPNNEAIMYVTNDNGNTDEFLIGLDNPRVTHSTNGVYTHTGNWKGEDTFVLNVSQLEYLHDFNVIIHYSGEEYRNIKVTEVATTGNDTVFTGEKSNKNNPKEIKRSSK